MSGEAIVIGGGIHGCCTALWLARLGWRPIVLEKDRVARHASGVNAGGVRRLLRDPAEVPLSAAAMDVWLRIEAELGDDCGFHTGGQLAIAETAADMAKLEQRAAEVRALGFDHEELVDGPELRRLVPALAQGCVGGLIARADGHADPYRTTQAFRRAAEASGARFREGTAVRGADRVADHWRVRTSTGHLDAEVVVNCGGAWGGRVAAQFGDDLPGGFFAPMMMVSARMPRFLTPVVIGTGRALSFKQTDVGTLVIGGGQLGRGDLDAGSTRLSPQRLANSARTVLDLFPIMAQAEIVRGWAGLESLMPDGIPIIGASDTTPGLWHAYGFSGHGFQLGPVVGRAIAESIARGSTALPIHPFRPGRFADRRAAE